MLSLLSFSGDLPLLLLDGENILLMKLETAPTIVIASVTTRAVIITDALLNIPFPLLIFSSASFLLFIFNLN